MRRRRGWDRMGGCSIATMDSHQPIYSPGYFSRRAHTLNDRNFSERAFTVGIGGPVATGKTALMLALCRFLRDKYSLAVVTNDIFTKEDGEFLVKNGALPEERIRAVETGGCPHAAIREDISINLGLICFFVNPVELLLYLQIEMMSEAIDETLDKDQG